MKNPVKANRFYGIFGFIRQTSEKPAFSSTFSALRTKDLLAPKLVFN